MATATAEDLAVRTDDLGKTYGDRPAVIGLDLAVPRGVTFGFLGPNGAGKTTTLSMLCTLLRPTAGRAFVGGHDVVREPHAVRERIGLVFQETTLDLDLTAREALRFHAELFGTPWRQSRRTVAALLELVGLTESQGRPVREFSGGMRRRLEIARGLLTAPQVLFLDEPTTGLDPQTRTVIWEHLHRLREERGITLFLTTHHLEEAENCDRLAIIDNGQIEVEGSPAELKAEVGDDTVVLRTCDDAGAALLVRERFGVAASSGPDGVRLSVSDGAAFVPKFCAEAGIPVLSATVTPPSLDDVFLHHTGRTIRTERGGPLTVDDVGRRR
ncbi:ATP-binding cassette domain-containing protein [Streptomyces spirodelae]|uniref:ATP-binding cassette domain-containing protein n=1 Tax=Streptomyces spirodelae TaxID=2812904 RepID=A0ABS3WXD2_9ACTN|nr:ATP-binding cassette domain-containing protein [Streptomyces spirodelae]MBO8187506.1 ATP-binding cassette domain-containing protein [Streptomyces spirodelae]